MKYWTELATDAFEYFEWFSKEEALKNVGYVPSLSVFNMIGSQIYTIEEQESFTSLCAKLVTKFALEKEAIQDYHFYLFGIVETENINSKIFKHQKLWKPLKKEFELDKFSLGPEVEHQGKSRLSYASIAEISLSGVLEALRITARYPQKYALIASKRQSVMTERFIKSLQEKVYLEDDKSAEIDYFKLVLSCCLEGDLVFRWGSSSEERELDIIVIEKKKEVFQGVSFEE